MSSLTTSLSVPVGTVAEAQQALESAFDRCSRSLYRYMAVRTGGDAHLADDLMQQLWLQAARSELPGPEDQCEFWLRRIAANLIRAHWRRQSRRPADVPLAEPQLAEELSDRLVSDELPPDVLHRNELRYQLLLAITELPSCEQEFIVAHYFHEVPFAKLARKLGLSERAVEGRLYRARQCLRDKLKHLA